MKINPPAIFPCIVNYYNEENIQSWSQKIKTWSLFRDSERGADGWLHVLWHGPWTCGLCVNLYLVSVQTMVPELLICEQCIIGEAVLIWCFPKEELSAFIVSTTDFSLASSLLNADLTVDWGNVPWLRLVPDECAHQLIIYGFSPSVNLC